MKVLCLAVRYGLFLTLICFNSVLIFADHETPMSTVPTPNPNQPPPRSEPNNAPPAILAPVVGPNVRCNDRVTCSDGRGITQSETAVAISGNVVLCSYNDFRALYCPSQSPGYQWVGWSYSVDGGETFSDGGPLPGRTLHRGDPWAATGADGAIFLSGIWNDLRGLAVTRGTPTEKGIEWAQPTVIDSPPGTFDKEAITVDPNTGDIYLSYTRLGVGIWLHRSTDGGQSFLPHTVVTTGGVQGSCPAAGPNGEVYVAWNIGWPGQTGIGFAKSADQGATFGPSRTIGQICNFPIPGLDRPNPAFPQITVDNTGGPNTGNIYVVWHTACPRGNGDVVMIRSTDGGETWSNPLVINDDATTAIQFYPTISIDDLGRVNVFFYDRREDPGTVMTNLFFAQSTDGAMSFNPNIKVTSVTSRWGVGEGSPNFGDYINSTSVGTKACVAWTDSRDGDPDAYFTCVDVPDEPPV